MLFRRIGDGVVFGTRRPISGGSACPRPPRRMRGDGGARSWLADWAGGLIWLQIPATTESAAKLARASQPNSAVTPVCFAPPLMRGAKSAVFEPEPAGACKFDESGETGLRSEKPVQSRPHVRISLMRTNFRSEQLTDPHTARCRTRAAHLCSLRFLHRHLPDLCAAGR